MNDWEEWRKKSLCYYIFLVLLLWPIFLVTIDSLISMIFLGLDMLIPFLPSSALILGLIFSLGARYRYRGINPSLLNIVNANEGHYFERIGPDESDYL
jgi:hypothetical protein